MGCHDHSVKKSLSRERGGTAGSQHRKTDVTPPPGHQEEANPDRSKTSRNTGVKL